MEGPTPNSDTGRDHGYSRIPGWIMLVVVVATWISVVPTLIGLVRFLWAGGFGDK